MVNVIVIPEQLYFQFTEYIQYPVILYQDFHPQQTECIILPWVKKLCVTNPTLKQQQ